MCYPSLYSYINLMNRIYSCREYVYSKLLWVWVEYLSIWVGSVFLGVFRGETRFLIPQKEKREGYVADCLSAYGGRSPQERRDVPLGIDGGFLGKAVACKPFVEWGVSSVPCLGANVRRGQS